MNLLSRVVGTACLAATLSNAFGQAPGAAPPPVEAFFQFPTMSGAELSPTGRHIIVLTGSLTTRQELLVVDTETFKAKAIGSFKDADVADAHWVNDKRVVYHPIDLTKSIRNDEAFNAGLIAVDITGGEPRRMARVAFHSATRDMKSDDIIVVAPKTDDYWNFDSWAFTTVNTRLNNNALLFRNYEKSLGARRWLMGRDSPDVAVGIRDGRYFVLAWNETDKKWHNILRQLDGGSPVAIAPDGALIVAYGGRERADLTALYRFDLGKLEYESKPLFTAPEDFDSESRIVFDSQRVLGVRLRTGTSTTLWIDDKMAAIQRDVDAALPQRANEIHPPLRGELPVVLVNSYSDRDPGSWYVFDTEKKTLRKLGDAMTGIDPNRMGTRELVKYKARDGLEIPAWLTLPAGATKQSKLPMVVMVHGGPFTHGPGLKWEDEPQFLASRGYAVLEPQFRGTRGYGLKHYVAGVKQWGLAMQDDLADGARWAIEQGVADASRICIAGSSYGGYASMMGLIKDPDLFRCGINWTGVTDIDLMYSAWFSDMTSNDKAYLSVMAGDPDKDVDQIKATSPLRLANKIHQPVLLAYGGEDRRVPITHGRRFRNSLQHTNKNVEWIEYSDEAHGWRMLRNRVDFWKRVEAFLAKSMAAPRP